jgi:hypothetical protein
VLEWTGWREVGNNPTYDTLKEVIRNLAAVGEVDSLQTSRTIGHFENGWTRDVPDRPHAPFSNVCAAILSKSYEAGVRDVEAVGNVNVGWTVAYERGNGGNKGVVGEDTVIGPQVEGLEELWGGRENLVPVSRDTTEGHEDGEREVLENSNEDGVFKVTHAEAGRNTASESPNPFYCDGLLWWCRNVMLLHGARSLSAWVVFLCWSSWRCRNRRRN